MLRGLGFIPLLLGANANSMKTRREAILPATDCTLETSAPICADNGVTYENDCLLKEAADRLRPLGLTVDFQYDGPCTETRVCNDMCTQEYAPVCASNLETYGNLCGMEAAACKSGGKLTVLAEITCAEYIGEGSIEEQIERLQEVGERFDGDTVRTTQECPDTCDDNIFKVVCGTDGKSYINECDLRMSACARHFPKLATWYDGTCTGDDTDKPLYTDEDIHEYVAKHGDTFGLSQGNDLIAAKSDNMQGQSIDNNSGSTVNVGLLVGIFIAIVVVVVVVMGLVYMMIKRGRNPEKKKLMKSPKPSVYEGGRWNSARDVTDAIGKMPDGDVDVGV